MHFRDVSDITHLLGGVAAGEPFPWIAFPCFAVLFVAVAVWLMYVLRLFSLLRDNHPSTFEEMGSPSLFWNNSVRNNVLFLKFLFSSKWRALGDPEVETVVLGLRWVIFINLLLFVLCMVLVFR
jgi:hypothetical protein